MACMPALHVRNVPQEVYEALRARAQRNGRSLNSEALAILRGAVTPAGALTPEQALERIRRRRKKTTIPGDEPRPEEIIRELRDSGG